MGNIVSTIRQLRLFGLSDKLKAAKTLRGPTLHQAPKRGNRASMSHVAQSFLRGLLVVAFVLLPAMLLPGISQDVAQAATLIALISGAVVMAEYAAAYPGLIEFRDAKPYNRLRFGMLVAVVLVLAVLQRGVTAGDPGVLGAVALWLAGAFDFSFSPIRLLVLSLPQGLPVEHLLNVMASAALAFVMCFFRPVAVRRHDVDEVLACEGQFVQRLDQPAQFRPNQRCRRGPASGAGRAN